ASLRGLEARDGRVMRRLALISPGRWTALVLAAVSTLGGEAAAQAYRVKDIWPGPTDGWPQYLAKGDAIFFQARDDDHGAELWRSDGTAEGTWLVKDVAEGRWGSEPQELTPALGLVYFHADGGLFNRDALFRTDGTEAGTIRLTNGGLGVQHIITNTFLYFTFRDD